MNFVSVVVLTIIIANVNSRVIKYKDIPLNGDTTLKITVKMDHNGNPVAKIRMIEVENDEVDTEQAIPLSIPNFDDRNGFRFQKCAVGFVTKGRRCIPLAK
ncbi:unnamed protein product [Leptidea sinapis]|uniref:Uncharacterized protein n=1 Tax=Leptidea sinapis TaxID=189913 RepID=A0A5E4R6B5_9NEOP|nr:unnamed protein product [Leptidea sinapis]